MDYQRFRDHVVTLPDLEMQSGMHLSGYYGPVRFKRLRSSINRGAAHRTWRPLMNAAWLLFIFGWMFWWVYGSFFMITAVFSSNTGVPITLQTFRVDAAVLETIAAGLPVLDSEGKIIQDTARSQVYILDLPYGAEPSWAIEPSSDDLRRDLTQIVVLRPEPDATLQEFIDGHEYLQDHWLSEQVDEIRVFYYSTTIPRAIISI